MEFNDKLRPKSLAIDSNLQKAAKFYGVTLTPEQLDSMKKYMSQNWYDDSNGPWHKASVEDIRGFYEDTNEDPESPFGVIWNNWIGKGNEKEGKIDLAARNGWHPAAKSSDENEALWAQPGEWARLREELKKKYGIKNEEELDYAKTNGWHPLAKSFAQSETFFAQPGEWTKLHEYYKKKYGIK